MVSKLKEWRRSMIYAMGSRCFDCGKEFDPDELIIDHTAFPDVKLGYQSPARNRPILEWHRTHKIPQGVRLLCDSCNRKRHGYRPSKKEIFGL